MSKTMQTDLIDGRRARSERSKQAIVDAVLELMEEGNLIPTAQQIADRSGVKIRSFFRHFEDMETLFATIDSQNREATEALFIGGDRTGALEERIVRSVERRAEGFEKYNNMILSTTAQLWRSDILRKNYARYQRGLRKDLERWLPEIKALSHSEREAVEAVSSFEMWHRLRYHQALNRAAAAGVQVAMLNSLLAS